MRGFVGSLVSFVSVLVFVSCGAHDGSSHLARRNTHNNNHYNNHNNHNNNHNDTSDGAHSSEGSSPGQVDGRFPLGPDATMTPGSLCERGSHYRYPEHVKYCERNVDHGTKAAIFVAYDQKLGFETTKMDRMAFKIDHLIPLCLGGSNDTDNLWPQHVSIYEHTDPIEPFLCGVLAAGKIKQAEAVQLILTIKQSPFTADAELRKLESMY